MNINKLSNLNFSANRPKRISSPENQMYSAGLRRMSKSPLYGVIAAEDFQAQTDIRTRQHNMEHFFESGIRQPETSKLPKAQIKTAQQAAHVEKLIQQLELEKIANPDEAKSIGGQIYRLKGLLRKFRG